MRIRRPVVIGWALLAAGGWAATQWLGEPVATTGGQPAPAPSAWVTTAPGPQPEGSCPDRPAPAPAPTRPPAPAAWPSPSAGQYGSPGMPRDCAYVVLHR